MTRKLECPQMNLGGQIPANVRNSLKRALLNTKPATPSFVPKNPIVLSTDLIKACFRNGLVDRARLLFDEMPHRDSIAYTVMISGYASCDLHRDALATFRRMLGEESALSPNEFTLSSALSACVGLGSVACGMTLHCFAAKVGVDRNVYVENVLVGLYASCCETMDDACKVFRGIRERNVVSWTTLISGFAHKGEGLNAIMVFRQMLLEGAELNPFSLSIAVRACASIRSHFCGRQLHAAVIKHRFDSSFPVMNSVLDMYCRCHCLLEARKCFHEMPEKDLITWNTLIAGYERLESRESLRVFSWMVWLGIRPNSLTYTSVTAACGNLASLDCGKQVHGGIIQSGFEDNTALANALIDMYAKCGSIIDSQRIFSSMRDRNLLSWTCIMIGYGANGCGHDAIKLFDEMTRSGIKPDEIAFMAVLSACSRAGLVEEGLGYFKRMAEYNIVPSVEVYACVVDLLGRAGKIEEAYQLVERIPFEPDESIWGALLGACRAHGNQTVAKLAARRVLELKPCRPSTYVTTSQIFAVEGAWEQYNKVRQFLGGSGNKKETGRSWTE